ncbi:cob(I)yrinic acid a,c-diamide adenosyltransferase [Ancylomarina sp. 16SWW S1-10-2]|uniref:cob(I)yrinic acid a,c-diamide adenosyltransferase n=1 Tax=Ancylomarina sp. 16SWW S1-10-2 TaxID=2499681 RepID=UPI0012AE7EB9|nr:cob(I)yrinic acid a,c-diamide adenosyltransferase [Ancylomarina sp. 16SWW S1-10-2]MRT93154.1 cob(I)yrinic acid a,c-diamide adenosyltransferase [Ancylomarina sp. 16SWW S1-10-2]
MTKFKVYTKTGDSGTTGLIGGTRVPKHHLRLEAYGTIDELNSYIGLIRSHEIETKSSETLLKIQNKLFLIGSRLATDDTKSDLKEKLVILEDDILLLENEMDRMDESLPELNNFVLAGGSPLNAYCHIARTVCRRAERRVNQLSAEVNVNILLLKYINRLSDYLFILSRKVLIDMGKEEIKWETNL